MDKDVEQLCKVCQGCQVTSHYDPPEPMSCVLPPSAPWQDCSADLLGPLPCPYADEQRRAVPRSLRVGDAVLRK